MSFDELVRRLKEAGVADPEVDARILLEEFSGDALKAAAERRISREPLQYIIGRWPFYREEYFVSPACLIPRGDTEVLVEYLEKNAPRVSRFLDLCTGSGCIAISLAKNRPDASGLAADISEDALEIAKRNAEHNGVTTVDFFRTDVKLPSALCEKFDFIVSNPPYIQTDVVSTLEKELFYEPSIALDGGMDGMDFYKAIVENYKDCLKEHGFFAFELGYDQRDAAKELAATYGFDFSEIYDYGGNFRAAIFKK